MERQENFRQAETMLTSNPERPPLCATAPILWGLVPLVLGIVCAACPHPVAASIPVGSCLFLAGWWLPVRKLPLAACFILGFWCQNRSMDEPHPDWEKLPPREATLVIEVAELFNTRKGGHVSGIGKILHCSIPHDTLSGNRISFYLENPAGGDAVGKPGAHFSCMGVVTYLPSSNRPDPFQEYLISRDIFTTINRGKVLGLISPAPGLEELRSSHFKRFQKILRGNAVDNKHGNVLASMMLGDRSLLTDSQISLYKNSGTYHLFAVSGLHVGCMGIFITGLLRLVRLRHRWWLPVVLLVVWYYVWLTGSSPSSVRSGIMISCLVSSRLLWRQGHLFPALVTSAWIVLLIQPSQLYSLGFQLSYAVVASIILIGLPLAGYLTGFARGHPENGSMLPKQRRILLRAGIMLLEITSISISAGCVSMPLIIQHFNL